MLLENIKIRSIVGLMSLLLFFLHKILVTISPNQCQSLLATTKWGEESLDVTVFCALQILLSFVFCGGVPFIRESEAIASTTFKQIMGPRTYLMYY